MWVFERYIGGMVDIFGYFIGTEDEVEELYGDEVKVEIYDDDDDFNESEFEHFTIERCDIKEYPHYKQFRSISNGKSKTYFIVDYKDQMGEIHADTYCLEDLEYGTINGYNPLAKKRRGA
tara:strand:+ start:3554 stop:3913 length:360 start_codon:yes stop_codon:yes gene_type:complete